MTPDERAGLIQRLVDLENLIDRGREEMIEDGQGNVRRDITAYQSAFFADTMAMRLHELCIIMRQAMAKEAQK